MPGSAAAGVLTPTALASARTWQPGSVIRLFVSNGTAAHPNAGLVIGTGYSFGRSAGDCTVSSGCSGSRGGLLLGNIIPVVMV